MARSACCLLVILYAILCTSGCGNRNGHRTWPATLSQVSGFNDTQSAKIDDGITQLNDQFGKVVLSHSAEEGFLIGITLISTPANEPSRGGSSTHSGTECRIELTDESFRRDNGGFVQSILWHELGHCAGLGHVAEPNEVMSAVSVPTRALSREALERFFSQLKAATGL